MGWGSGQLKKRYHWMKFSFQFFSSSFFFVFLVFFFHLLIIISCFMKSYTGPGSCKTTPLKPRRRRLVHISMAYAAKGKSSQCCSCLFLPLLSLSLSLSLSLCLSLCLLLSRSSSSSYHHYGCHEIRHHPLNSPFRANAKCVRRGHCVQTRLVHHRAGF